MNTDAPLPLSEAELADYKDRYWPSTGVHARCFATIDALRADLTAAQEAEAALESIIAIGRLSNYVDMLASGEEIHFSDELRELARALLGKEDTNG